MGKAGDDLLDDPLVNRSVTFARGYLFFEGSRLDSDEGKESLIHGTIEFIISLAPQDRGPAFVQNAGQDYELAQANTRAAGGCFAQIWA